MCPYLAGVLETPKFLNKHLSIQAYDMMLDLYHGAFQPLPPHWFLMHTLCIDLNSAFTDQSQFTALHFIYDLLLGSLLQSEVLPISHRNRVRDIPSFKNRIRVEKQHLGTDFSSTEHLCNFY